MLSTKRILSVALLAGLLGAVLAGGPRADVCTVNAWENGTVGAQARGWLFPNWDMVPLGSFDALSCLGCAWVGTENIIGLTVVNFGTATSSDINAVYWQANCVAGKAGIDSGIVAMTYAGMYVEDSGIYPAWTWAGVSPDYNLCDDYCGGVCGTFFTINIFADIDDCPAQDKTVQLGFPINSVSNTSWWGSITDNAGCAVPWYDMKGEEHRITYALKEADKDVAAPGDTVTYRIYYGTPGSSVVSDIVIMDTMPPYTHYIPGSSASSTAFPSLGLDPSWDPDPGPPMRLRWTEGGPISPAGGATREISFSLTVDWGNGEGFEPGSGDVAAPEGEMLGNRAEIHYNGSDCTPKSRVTAEPVTAVRRFLFWKLADNDVLFAPGIGQSPDEITYSIFIKNTSATKTWWNVDIWDTVAAELDVWPPNLGFYDPMLGWTMSPTGLSPGNPSWTDVAGQTRLKWIVDLPPGATIELRWKAVVKNSASDGDVALTRASILERGRTGIVGGTGHSIKPAVFTHEAPIVLRTVYLSYLSITGVASNWWECCNDDPLFATESYFISFFPLNKQTSFALYNQVHDSDVFAQEGGLSPPINNLVGGCTDATVEWVPGCKAERAPAFYKPSAYAACELPNPMHDLFKLVSNSPVIWEMLTGDIHSGSEMATYADTTSLTYRGYACYTYVRTCVLDTNTDGLFFVNTSPAGRTTVHVFSWDPTVMTWQYRDSGLIDKESVWFYLAPFQASYRIISSDYRIIIWKGLPETGNPSYRTMAPNKETGYLVSEGTPSTFYAFAERDDTDGGAMVVGNVGTANATYEVWKYRANNLTLPMISWKHQSNYTVGKSGSWVPLRVDNVPAGQANPLNPHAYQGDYDEGVVVQRTFYKVKLLSGGPIQVYCGYQIHSSFDGAHAIHAADGGQGGYDYWFHHTHARGFAGDCGSPNYATMSVDVFMPKQGTVVRGHNNSGYDATFTTDGPDECISFKALTPPDTAARENWRFEASGGIIAVCIANTCHLHQKMFTAPFVSEGVHYDIILPPVVYSGQEFWMTIIVVESAGGTKDDYCGTTGFTATDPSAEIDSTPLESYTYTWSNDVVPCNSGSDNGVVIFVKVRLDQIGLQNIIAMDTNDGSIVGIGATMVVGVDVKLTKEPKFGVAASGDIVQFAICWSNYSSASAANFVITDAVPNGFAYVQDTALSHFLGATNGFGAATVAYSTTDDQHSSFSDMPGGGTATAAWLRWTIPQIGVNTTGCVGFKAAVD